MKEGRNNVMKNEERERELVGILVVSESMETRERVTMAMLYYIGGSVQI
jgi:hypothetical protein